MESLQRSHNHRAKRDRKDGRRRWPWRRPWPGPLVTLAPSFTLEVACSPGLPRLTVLRKCFSGHLTKRDEEAMETHRDRQRIWR